MLHWMQNALKYVRISGNIQGKLKGNNCLYMVEDMVAVPFCPCIVFLCLLLCFCRCV